MSRSRNLPHHGRTFHCTTAYVTPSKLIKTSFLIGLFCALLTLGQSIETASPQKAGRPAETLRIDVDLVLITVAVTDPKNQYVAGLKQQDFRVWEDNVEQELRSFSTEDIPVSVGIIFDSSDSMRSKWFQAISAADAFLRLGNSQDEYFIVDFKHPPRLVQDFTTSTSALERSLGTIFPEGTTALFDAVYFGLHAIERAANSRKALLVITDGEDNSSRYTFSELKQFAKERDVQIFSIGIEDEPADFIYVGQPNPRTPLRELAKLTGGYAFFPSSLKDLGQACVKIGTDLRNQYVLGYRSTNGAKNGKWRKIKVQVNRPDGMPRLNVRARTGYYAPALERAMK
jgi:Ca-activated chloride channel homolog